MTNEQIASMLSREGIDYHSITDREQFMETARHVLASKMKVSKKSDNTYFKTVCVFAILWTILRLYWTGGLSFLARTASSIMTGDAQALPPAPADDAADFFGD
ncbi:hypothetical protein PINS_up000482 [Pythium insidiosum]|nr:hypothetical protein PINS_up000482 [Pythium insidiosum]